MPFFYSLSDSTGARVPGADTMFSPNPTRVDYPTDPAGSYVTTADGNVVQQQPSKDGRIYAFEWHNYPSWQVAYGPLYARLEGLRSRYRKEMGLSPYVWIKDSETDKLRKKITGSVTTVAGTSATQLVLTGVFTADYFKGASFTMTSGSGINLSATGLSHAAGSTNTTVPVTPSFSTAPAAGQTVSYLVWQADWVRVRVLKVARTLRDDGGDTRYPLTRLEFVVDDNSWNALG